MVTSWPDMQENVENLKKAMADYDDDTSKDKENSYIRSILRTITSGNEGWEGFERLLQNNYKATEKRV